MKLNVRTLCSIFLGGVFLSGCASNQQLLFFTNSTIGVEASSSTASGNPVNFVVGYKRQEGIIDPIIPSYTMHPSAGTANDGIKEPKNNDTYVVVTPNGTALPNGGGATAHSVLAKINFGSTGGAAGATATQWFATGRAAEIIAKSPDVSSALTGQANRSIDIGVENRSDVEAKFITLDTVYNLLSKSAASDKNARSIKDSVDSLDSDELRKKYTVYSRTPDSSKYISSEYPVDQSRSLGNALTYLGMMGESSTVASDLLTKSAVKLNDKDLDEAVRKTVLADLQRQRDEYISGVSTISKSQDVISMVDYVYKNILLSEGK